MKPTNSPHSPQIPFIILSFLLPALLLTLTFIAKSIAPFGDKTILTSDLYYQYIDYFAWLRSVLLEGKSLSYSFSISLGNPTITQFAYYLASPLNLLVIFFTQEDLPSFVLLLTVLKIGLSGLTMYLFCRHRFPAARNIYLLQASAAYALMYYNVSQTTNIMWLDGVYMLPLILLGAYRILEQKSTLLFVVSVCAAIIFNWYTAYMNCLFVFLYFLYELSLKSWKRRENLKKIAVFTVYEGIGVLLSAFYFLPVILGMAKSKVGVETSDIFKIKFNGNILNSVRGLFLGLEFTDGTRQFSAFCGTIFVIGILFYFFNKNVERNEKIKTGIFLGVMAMSAYVLAVENIWNGLRYASSYYCRFGYLISFSIIMIGLKGLLLLCDMMDECLYKKTVPPVVGILLLFSLFDLIAPFGELVYQGMTGILLLYFLWACMIRKRGATVVLTAALCLELFWNSFLVYRTSDGTADRYGQYAAGQMEQLTLLRQYDDYQTNFYRLEETMNRQMSQNGIAAAYNDSMAYGYYGLANYASTTYEGVVDFASKCGYYDKGAYIIPYSESILPSDSLLGIKYVLSPRDIPGYELVPELSQNLNGKNVYVNRHALPLGFAVTSAVLNETCTDNPFTFQNDLYSKILGRTCQIFKPASYQQVKEGENLVIQTVASPDQEDILYACAEPFSADLPVFIDDAYRTQYHGWLTYKTMCLGTAGEPHTLRFEKVQEPAESFSSSVYFLDKSEWEAAVEEIRAGAFTPTLVNDSLVEGVYEAAGDTRLFLSIPYDEGWKITINGKRVKAEKGLNNFLTFPVAQGTNHIVCQYKTQGNPAGIGLSLAGVMGFAGMERRRKKKVMAYSIDNRKEL